LIQFRFSRLGLVLCVCLLLIISASLWSVVSAQRRVPGVANTPITHVVIIMMENHTFDNMFGTFPEANGVILPRASNPFRSDYNHSGPATLAALDNGAMDEFPQRSMVQYVQSDIPTYWDYAVHFGLGDNFFSSAATNSAPNHVSMVAGQTGDMDDNEPYGCFGSANDLVYSRKLDSTQYWSYPCYNIASEPQLLDKASLTWKYYGSVSIWDGPRRLQNEYG
jgi:phospholipase C